MIDREILRKLRQIQIRTSALVTDAMAGEYQSAFRGRGMEFSEVRQYFPGDDVRSIDWNVTARMGEPHVKRFVEERELTVMLLIDMSGSGSFGTRERTKNEIAAELSAVLAFSAIRNNDRVGLIIFTDRIEKYVPPKKGKKHVLRVIRDLLVFEPEGGRTDIRAELEYLNKVQRKRAVCFLVSDFDGNGFERDLLLSSRRHDLVAVSVTDPREEQLPPIGLLELIDAETGETVLVDAGDPSMRSLFATEATRFGRDRTKMFRRIGVDHVETRTDEPYVEPLLRFFRMRERRIR